MRLLSWNVNGIRACAKKDFVQLMQKADADVICLQETKANPDQVKECLWEFKGYEMYCNSAVKPGYSGTAILTRIPPLSIQNHISIEEHDQEGRVIAAEFPGQCLYTEFRQRTETPGLPPAVGQGISEVPEEAGTEKARDRLWRSECGQHAARSGAAEGELQQECRLHAGRD